MTDLEFLQRRYKQIIPDPLVPFQKYPERLIRLWITDDVCPFLHQYVRRPKFQEQAIWPIRSLRLGAKSAERQIVDRVDQALIDCAKAMLRVANLSSVRRHLASIAPLEVGTLQEVWLNGKEVRPVRSQTTRIKEVPLLLSQVTAISKRFWSDLVNVNDYFEPLGGWNLPKATTGQAGDFVVSLNPELHPGGDFISRCLIRRIEGLKETLQRLLTLFGEVVRGGRVIERRYADFREAWKDLTDLVGKLRHVCLQDEKLPLRDSCILLTQLYAAFQAKADIDWLGLPEQVISIG